MVIMESCYPELDRAFATAEWERIRIRLLNQRPRANSQSRGIGADQAMGQPAETETGAYSVSP